MKITASRIAHQINFSANWISLPGVAVGPVSTPAVGDGLPVPSKMSVRNRAVDGRAKLARFRTSKNSARNCTLKLSEILLIVLFLNTEKSRFIRPGPVTLLRPELPRRLKHSNGGRRAGGGVAVL